MGRPFLLSSNLVWATVPYTCYISVFLGVLLVCMCVCVCVCVLSHLWLVLRCTLNGSDVKCDDYIYFFLFVLSDGCVCVCVCVCVLCVCVCVCVLHHCWGERGGFTEREREREREGSEFPFFPCV